jgi:sec-independent protein translocase protein TatA
VLAFFNMSWPEMLVILIIALLIFGNRLPEVMRSLGKSVNEFKKGMGEMGDQMMTDQAHHASPPPPAAAPPQAAAPAPVAPPAPVAAPAPAPAPAPPTSAEDMSNKIRGS